MSLPIILFFERHWDTTPKSVIQNSLSDLSKRGYETICIEAPQNVSAEEIIDQHNAQLEFDSKIFKDAENRLIQKNIYENLSDMSFGKLAMLMQWHVSSLRYLEVAEKIKNLPASRMLKEVFLEAKKLSMSLKGIDIDREDYSNMFSDNPAERMSNIRLKEDHRITTMVQNLLKLRAQQEEGIIFVCGASHAKNLIDEFKKQGLGDQVLYYFPHSSSRFDERGDDINEIMQETRGTLEGHTHLLDQEDIKPFSEGVIREITEKTKYQREILNHNPHAQFLTECFNANFRAFVRPGHHVDALLDATERADIEEIQRRVSAVGVKTHKTSLNGRIHLVIPNVNTEDVAERIRKIAE